MNVGNAPLRLLTETLDGFLAPWNTGTSPGVLAAITAGDTRVYERAVGMADLAHSVPLGFDSVMRVASQSKQFTVLLALMLEADGKLSFEDDIRDYLPFLPDYGTKITLRHLASNTSGLRDILEMLIISGVPILSPSSRALSVQLAALSRDLNFPVGEDLVYSNTNFLLLSEILEIASGQSFNALLRERITGPLGMPSTRLMARDDVILPNLATHHRRHEGEWLKSTWGIAIGGEGGMVSTGNDMQRWLAELRQPTLCDPGLIARMEAPGATINSVDSPYGMGLVWSGDGLGRGVGHGGWIAGSRSLSIRFPQADASLLILANHDEFSPFAMGAAISALIAGTTIQDRSACSLECGHYREVGGNDLFVINDNGAGRDLVTSMGSSALIGTAEAGWTPNVAIPPFTLSSQSPNQIVATKFGRQRAFRKITSAPANDRPPLAPGRYHAAAEQLDARIFMNSAGVQCLYVCSPMGAATLELAYLEDNFYIVHPAAKPAHDQWRFAPWILPWVYTLTIEPDHIVINSDRTKSLRLDAVS
ncbi:serine hydrolase domain-containing protein [Devosia limi]|uniref:CubicO group peptidase, beta-lactamase class C family n=1 Tax=Devosia limi DSM 17137 TaxID=1121477 RepID=A0A1M4TKK6_9HYPH|nr:serine hydrolase domain-containing protein [Devosia limi]SHE44925.1 CubicO group peptidase, beta-lactamase class C family [Devosia limi DSM 17137]